MRISTLIKNNLTHYWRTNAAVVIGVATAVSVLAGALLVGDSVRASLRDLVLLRLGNADHIISAPDFFREQLADDVQSHSRFAEAFDAACPIIALEGLVTHQESARRASGVQIYGVDERFWKFNGRESNNRAPSDREVLISPSLAEELGSKSDDSLLVRVQEPSIIPAESLHGRKEDAGLTVRLNIRESLPPAELGEFSIRPQQGAVRAVFVSLQRLQKELEIPGKVNTILLSEKGDSLNPQLAQQAIEQILKDSYELEDLKIKLRALEDRGSLSLESDAGLIGDALADTAKTAASNQGMRTSSYFTYLANSIRSGERDVPYSLVTAVDDDTYQQLKGGANVTAILGEPQAAPILLNDWAASDLGIKVGDPITLEYYVWLDEGRLITRTAEFYLDGIIPLAGAAADRDLAPEYPGITDSDDVTDWDPPFEIDLSRIRQRDEDYWDRYRATPKAFIRLEKGQELWQSRYGKLTSIRIYPSAGGDLQAALNSYRESLKSDVDPLWMGLSDYPAKAQGLDASRGATDFGEYFVYFSFFLVISALLLTSLFFRLGIEQRLREIGLLKAIGFPAAKVRAIFLIEGVALATAGSLLGIVGAVAYGALMMYGLRTWWVGAVGTTLLSLHITPASLIFGGAGGVLAALVCIWWTLRKLAPASPRSLLAGSLLDEIEKTSGVRKVSHKEAEVTPSPPHPLTPSPLHISAPIVAAIALAALGLLMLTGALMGWIGQVAGFFGAGFLLLVALLSSQWAWLRGNRKKAIQGNGWWPVARMGFRNATYRPGRSVLSIALIASAAFIIVAVDAFRRDASNDPLNQKSGTGGFPLLAESQLPILHNPNTVEGREALNLIAPDKSIFENATFWQFRVRPGDDASCLNLYQPRNPRVIAASEEFINSGRFAFQDALAKSDEEKANPWLLLNEEMEDGAIPVIADANSLTYVLHLKLGDEFVIYKSGANPVRMRIVASLSDSIFQGELLMSEKNFIRVFPDQEGYRFFLLDAPPEKTANLTALIEDKLSDFGVDVIPTGERLARFHQVENTYLSTFQSLGGLGLLLGTLGLATVLLRNVLERRRELALLRAMGYNSSHFAITIVAENALLLLCGLLTGTVCALIAISPAFLSRGGNLSTRSLGILLLAVLVTGLAASLLATVAAIRTPLLPALRTE